MNRKPTETKHLVIGAGFAGLGMAHAFKNAGIAYDQVEAADHIGGNWYQGVYQHVHIVSSKETTEFPNFPMPASYPAFPSAKQMLDYLVSYADHAKLHDNIELNTKVTSATPLADGNWRVTLNNRDVRVYRGLVICNGHHWSPRHPSYPGTFTGEYLHSKEYKTTETLPGKRVLVIGAGNSACDIAVDAARGATESHISMRSGHWILPKTIFGQPLMEHLYPWVPQFFQKLMVRALVRIFIGKYSDYGFQQPDHGPYDKHPTINSLLPYYVKHGVIKVHPAVRSWNGKEVTFVDGTTKEFDLVIAATGFDVAFPFLPEGIVPIKNAIPQIPFGSFHDRYKGIYIIGWMQPRLGVGPLIAAGGPTISELILAQERMSQPIGAWLARLGLGIPKTHVADGYSLLRTMRFGRPLIRYLPLLEKIFPKSNAVQAPAPEQALPQTAKSPDLKSPDAKGSRTSASSAEAV